MATTSQEPGFSGSHRLPPERPPLYPEMTVSDYPSYLGRLRGMKRARFGSACPFSSGPASGQRRNRHAQPRLPSVWGSPNDHSRPEPLILDEPILLDPVRLWRCESSSRVSVVITRFSSLLTFLARSKRLRLPPRAQRGELVAGNGGGSWPRSPEPPLRSQFSVTSRRRAAAGRPSARRCD